MTSQPKRKFVHITDNGAYAIADDGTCWIWRAGPLTWFRVPDLPSVERRQGERRKEDKGPKARRRGAVPYREMRINNRRKP